MTHIEQVTTILALLAALAALAATLLCSLLVWGVSVRRHNVALADRAWPLLIMVSAVMFVVGLSAGDSRLAVMLALATAWAVRLSVFITQRSWGQPEERRYADMRQRNEPHFAWKSAYLVFGLQALLAWLVAMPFLAAAIGPRAGATWSVLDSLGAAVALFGLVYEAVADAQMAAFKRPSPRNAAKPGDVMRGGLWHYSRHPNYFGESCLWSGLALMAFSAGGWWAVVSPLLITALLLKVSGINLQEAHLKSRGSAYTDYVRRTSPFVPWRPQPGN